MQRIFLGGTCADTTWREELIKSLNTGISYFNPVVDDWTPACQANEIVEKNDKCGVHLYVITSAMKGVFSVAEVVESSMTPGKITVLHIIPAGFTVGELKSLRAVRDMVTAHGAIAYVDGDLRRTARVLNSSFTA